LFGSVRQTKLATRQLLGARYSPSYRTRDCVRCGPIYPQKKGTPTSPNFWPMSIVVGQMAGWMKTTLGTEVDLGPARSELPRKGHSSPLISAHVYCGHGHPSQLLLSSCTNGRPKISRSKILLLCGNKIFDLFLLTDF